MDENLTITLADLRKVLNQAVEAGYINQYGSHRILNLAKVSAVDKTNEDNGRNCSKTA